MCKHNWIKILPKPETVSQELRIDYAVDRLLANLHDIYYCDKCFHTGHVIKSYRSGMRRHYEGKYFIDKANEIRGRYLLPLLIRDSGVQVSDTRDDDSKGKLAPKGTGEAKSRT